MNCQLKSLDWPSICMLLLALAFWKSAYKECFYYKSEHQVYLERKSHATCVEGVNLESGHRIDLPENKLVPEIKSVDALNDVHLAQTLTYNETGQLQARSFDEF